MPERSFNVLLIEDDEGDADLTREGLKAGKIAVHLDVIQDGVEALAYLRKQGRYAKMPTPDLILLDLNLPKCDGREVLKEIKSDEGLKIIPVVILTTSKADMDILKTYGLGANCFITKPVGFEEFVQVVKLIEDFWFTVVKLPSIAS